MLDIPGCEMVWIGTSTHDLEDMLSELSREIEKEHEEADPEAKATEVMKEIQLDEKQHPTQALIDGQWPNADEAPEKAHDEPTKTETDDDHTEAKNGEE